MSSMMQNMQASIDNFASTMGCVADFKTSLDNVTAEIRSLKESLTEKVDGLATRVEVWRK